jgi:hypothetical protein
VVLFFVFETLPSAHMRLAGVDPSDWQYIGSGSANVVLGYGGSELRLKGKVVRLRLECTNVSTKTIFQHLTSSCFDPIRMYLVETELCEISREALQKFEQTISSLGLKQKVKMNETHCLIMRNIFSFPYNDYTKIDLNKYYKLRVHKEETIFEFKPKWLYNLPEGHMNCRNCLVAEQKKQSFLTCHLKVLQGKQGINEWCSEIQEELDSRGMCISVAHQLSSVIVKNIHLIEILFKLQSRTDVHEVLAQLTSQDDVNEELMFSMTLRDASIMYNLTTNEAFIVDLDMKSSTKWDAWKRQELNLQQCYLQESELKCRVKRN